MEDIPALIGGWKLHQTLSAGRYNSLVLSWQNIQTGENIVTKILRGDQSINHTQKANWIKEILFLCSCNNVNIIAVKDLPKVFFRGLAPINKQLLPVLCMEYCSTDLRQILLACENSCGLQENHVRQILQDLKNGLEFLNKRKISHNNLRPENIVRQDVKPDSNILTKDRTYIYKIIDIGLPRESSSGASSSILSVEKQYYAPELIINSAKSSDAADFWSFGLVAFEIICGVSPFFPCMNVDKWMVLSKMKSHDNICAILTFHGDIELSSEILPENHISKNFKALIEKWLKIALEWQPQLRGRTAPTVTLTTEVCVPYSNENLTIFTEIDVIINTFEVKIFSVSTLEYLSYNFNELTSVFDLKSKIKESTQIHESFQLLISIKTNREAEDDDRLPRYWKNNSSTTFYLFNRKTFLEEDIDCVIPSSVKRVMSDLKELTYNYYNSYELYRCGCYFVNSQKELCSSILKAIAGQVEYFQKESKQLLIQHKSLSNFIEKVEAKHEFTSNLIETGKEHILILNETNFKFLRAFKELFIYFDNISFRWREFDRACNYLTISLITCSEKISELSLQEYHSLVEKYDFKDIIQATNNAYESYIKNIDEHKMNDKVSVTAIKKACQDALKMKSLFLTELRQQTFIKEMTDLRAEISELKVRLQLASDHSKKLSYDISRVSLELSDIMWTAIAIPSNNIIHCNTVEVANNLQEQYGCENNYSETSTETEPSDNDD